MSDSTEKGFSELSDSSFLIQLAYPAIQELGLDVERIVSECKISPKLLKDRSARFPHAAQVQFWRVLEEVSGDKYVLFYQIDQLAAELGRRAGLPGRHWTRVL